MGTEIPGGGGRGKLCQLLTVTTIKLGSNGSHFNVSLIMRDRVTSVHRLQLLKREESQRGKPN